MKKTANNRDGAPLATRRVSGMAMASALVLSLILMVAPAQVRAAEAQARPTLKELKPVMEKAASDIFGEADRVTVKKAEVVEIGAPGWAPLTGPDKEEVFWPAKVKCTIAAPGRGGTEEMVLIIRAYRDGTAWKADPTEVYTIGSLQGILKARQTARRLACINNLRMLDGAKEQWALENRKKPTDEPAMTDLVGMDKYIRSTPTCPEGGSYSPNSMSQRPKCSVPGHELP